MVELCDPTQLKNLGGRIITRIYDPTIQSCKGSFNHKMFSYNLVLIIKWILNCDNRVWIDGYTDINMHKV